MLLENGKTICSCPKTQCKNYGKCVECIAAHKERDSLAYCKRAQQKQ